MCFEAGAVNKELLVGWTWVVKMRGQRSVTPWVFGQRTWKDGAAGSGGARFAGRDQPFSLGYTAVRSH